MTPADSPIRRRVRIVALTLIAAGLAGTAWAVVRGRPPAERAAGVAPATPPGPAGNGWFGGRAAPVPGGQSPRVELDVEMDARLTVGETATAAPGTRLSGRWTLTLIESGPAGSLVLAELKPGAFEHDAPRSPALDPAAYRARLAADLIAPLLLKIEADGRVAAVKAPPRVTASAASLLRAIPAAAQLAAGSGAEWSAEEQDTAGKFQAQYRRGAREITKRKVGYLSLDTGQGLRASEANEYRVVSSDGRYTLSDAGDAIRALHLTEQLRVQPGNGMTLVSTCSWKLTHVADRMVPTPRETLARLAPLDWSPLHAKPPAAAHDLDLDIAKVGNYTSVDQIGKQLDRLRGKTDAKATEERQALEVALTSLIRLKPSEGEAALARAARHGPGSDRLLLALARSGVPEAQRPLLAMLHEPGGLSPRDKGEIIVALASGPHPTDELVEGLERLCPDRVLGRQALLGMGAVAFQARAADPVLARRVLVNLGARLKRAVETGSFADAKAIFAAFGNAGHPESVAILEPFLTAHQPSVRAAAVGALRRVPGVEADQLLDRLVASDDSEEVQRAARKTAEDRRRLLSARLPD